MELLGTTQAVAGQFYALQQELVSLKPTLILPCSENKLPHRALAFDLYQGTGYLSIVKQWSQVELSQVFNLFFLSAKHGLIHASELIEPYEQVMTDERVSMLGANKVLVSKAQRHIQSMNYDAPLYLIVPKRYQKAFSELAGQAVGRFSQIVPATGGILSQRSQLKRLLVNEIDLARQRSRLPQTVVRTFTDSLPIQELHHVVSVGDWVRPWLAGACQDATFDDPCEIAFIECSPSGCVAFWDTNGKQWSGYSISAGIKRFGLSGESMPVAT
ncbi:DUF6884 domain-containing protein [Shewanella sp. GD03713]|uniref:DUF6884 domain-containing protein n=1 Tax=Shewanella sp. GD03713 TaxID=2975372 RepID=UPI001593BEFB|nr:DUF6884 domain-containing protein [Shewanella sp. GD03713]MDH1472727.1 hypothetical protein [Shewanella sp. GD03713]QXN27182.1 hypothetical protein KVP08_022010 [Shewanella putrefaciens]